MSCAVLRSASPPRNLLRGPGSRTRRAAAVLSLLVPTLAGCATAALGGADQEVSLKRAPYYWAERGAGPRSVAYAPLVYQAGGTGSTLDDPEGADGPTVTALVAAMNAYLDSLAVERWAGPVAVSADGAPDVYFGCERDGMDECVEADEVDSSFGPPEPLSLLAYGRPSGTWLEQAAGRMAAADADALLLLTLEVSDYWPRQTNWRGSKAVDLGTDRTEPLPWLTGLDTPISVIQLTGALVDPTGRAVRMGAEGLAARRTSMLAGAFGFQAMLTPEDLRELSTGDGVETWRRAMRTLVLRLVGEPERGEVVITR